MKINNPEVISSPNRAVPRNALVASYPDVGNPEMIAGTFVPSRLSCV
jgi:hypothetical protein